MTSNQDITLLGISGSLRAGSFSTAVLNTIMAAERAGVAWAGCDLGTIPLYNQDLDVDGGPAAVSAFRAAIARSDGLVVVSPEYNYGMPGVLKNALDWASRPGFASALKGKPVVYMTASPGALGGARAQVHLLEFFGAVLARPVIGPQVAIAGVGQKIEDGRLTDPPTLTVVENAVAALLKEIRNLRSIAAPTG